MSSIMKTISKYKMYYFVIDLILLIIYLPVVFLNYGFLDDYGFLWSISNGSNQFVKLLIACGRPIHAIAAKIFFGNIQYINQLSYLRLLSIILTFIFSNSFFTFINKYVRNEKYSILLTLVICCTPSYQLYISWTQYFINPIGLLFALLSSIWFLQYFKNERNENRKVGLLVLSYFSLLLSLLIHQSVSTFFWVMIIVDLTYRQQSIIETLKFILYSGITWFLSALSAYGVLLFGNYMYPLRLERSKLIAFSDISDKFIWFLSKVLVRALNFNHLNASYIIAVISSLIIIAGILINVSGNLQNKLIKLSLIILIIPLCYFPNLIVKENWESYRTQIGLSSILVILFILAVRSIVFLLLQKNIAELVSKALLSIYLVYTLATASYNCIIGISYLQAIDVSYMRSNIINTDFSEIEKIVIVRSNWSDSKMPVYFDEFGVPSSYAQWGPEPMARLLLHEQSPNYANIEIQILEPNSMVDDSNNILVIQMGNISSFFR